MKRIMWFVVCVMFMGSVSYALGDGMQRLQGAWLGDAESALAAQGLDRNSDDPGAKMIVQMLDQMSCDFGEGTMTMQVTMMGDTQTIDGTFDVLEEAENMMRIKNLDGPKAGVVSVITFNDNDHIQIAQEGSRRPPTYMKRVGGEDTVAPTLEAPMESAQPDTDTMADGTVIAQMMGAWVGDVDAALAAQGLDRASDDPAVKMLLSMMSGMKCKFGEGTIKFQVTMMGDTKTIDAAYEVLSTTPDSVTIKNLDGPKAGGESVITFADADHIMVKETMGHASPIYLVRSSGEITTDAEDEAGDVELRSVEQERPVVEFVVIIPEQIDTEWYWYYYTEVRQNIVQSQVEKAMIRKGIDIIDVNTLSMFRSAGTVDGLLNQTDTLTKAREAGATYLVLGKAMAVMQGRSFAYGVEVIRSKADASARIIRVSDGKIIKVLDAEAEEGGQAQKATGQEALKVAGKKLGRLVARAAQTIKEENE